MLSIAIVAGAGPTWNVVLTLIVTFLGSIMTVFSDRSESFTFALVSLGGINVVALLSIVVFSGSRDTVVS